MALGDYFETYVRRDLRERVQLRHVAEFERFVRLAAGRVGQLLNLQSLAADAGVSGHTAREWITLLEASFIAFRLPLWFANIGERLVKSPKLYFHDVGLAAWLVGIRQVEHLAAHPLRGHLFENPDLHFFRDSAGNEADLVLEHGSSLMLVEIKSARRVAPDAMRAVAAIRRGLGERATWSALVYDGAEAQRRSDSDVVPCAISAPLVEGRISSFQTFRLIRRTIRSKYRSTPRPPACTIRFVRCNMQSQTRFANRK